MPAFPRKKIATVALVAGLGMFLSAGMANAQSSELHYSHFINAMIKTGVVTGGHYGQPPSLWTADTVAQEANFAMTEPLAYYFMQMEPLLHSVDLCEHQDATARAMPTVLPTEFVVPEQVMLDKLPTSYGVALAGR